VSRSGREANPLSFLFSRRTIHTGVDARAEPARGQRAGHCLAGPGVLRRVSLKQQAGRAPGLLLAEVAQSHPGRGAERRPVPQRLVHLGVPGHGPDAVAVQPDHRAGLAQVLVPGKRVGQELVTERVNRRNRDSGRCRLPHRHGIPPSRPARHDVPQGAARSTPGRRQDHPVAPGPACATRAGRVSDAHMLTLMCPHCETAPGGDGRCGPAQSAAMCPLRGGASHFAG
jgi:hypothetical protein